jgi:hypothetical protein
MLPCCHSEHLAVILSVAKDLALRIFMAIRDSYFVSLKTACGSSPESGCLSCLDSINSSHACCVHFLESQIACVRLSMRRMTTSECFSINC